MQGQIDEEDQERSDDELEDDRKAGTGFGTAHVSETNSFKIKSDQSMKNIKPILKGRLASATTNLNRNFYKRGNQTQLGQFKNQKFLAFAPSPYNQDLALSDYSNSHHPKGSGIIKTKLQNTLKHASNYDLSQFEDFKDMKRKGGRMDD